MSTITFTVLGDEFDNRLVGTDFIDNIFGFAGNDTIRGRRGADIIDAGDGDDVILAGAARDVITTGAGDDFVNGAGGFDTVRYQGSILDYDIATVSQTQVIVSSINVVPDAGTDDLNNVEALYFAADDFTLYLNGRNNKVLSRDDALSAEEGETLSFTAADLMANDIDFDGDRLRIVDFEATSASGATITRDGDNFTYDAGTLFDGLDAGETATDTFSYRVGDGRGGSTFATVEVTINGADDIVPPNARINEFHYDNVGGDVGEFIEIRVEAGADASDLLVELYNGNDGEVYNTLSLSGLTATSDGTWDYYTLNLPANGLQNGSPDGIALSYLGMSIEFLSYEGTITAADGTAAGTMSEDILVQETSSTPVGLSLQRNDDGTWRAPAEQTPGVENVPPLAALVISEVLQNPAAVSDGSGEWFEIYNAGIAPVDINGWTVSDNGSDSFVIDNGGPLVIDAGGYLVLGTNADTATNGGAPVDYEYSGMFLSNGDDEIVLTDRLGREVDRVEWDGGPNWPDPTGASMSLLDLGADNNVGSNWAEATDAFGDGDLGTPGAANSSAAEQIVISEVMQNPSAVFDSAGEWFEVFNPGASDIDINGWTIADNDSDSHVIDNGGPLIVPAGGYLVLGNNGDSATNGGVTVGYEYSGVNLSNGADELVLTDTSGQEVDRVEWDGGPNWPDPTGASMQLDDTGADNNDGSNWSEATEAFGDGDLGTPNAANDSDGGGGGGGNDPTPLFISQIQGTGSASPVENQLVAATAIVTYVASNGFMMQEEDADADADALTSEGIFVFTGSLPTVALGDQVTVTGTVDEFNMETQISGNPTVEIISSGNPLPTAASLLLGPDHTADQKEALEGMRVSLVSATEDPITVVTNFNLDRFGSIEVAAGVKYQPTQRIDPDDQAAIDEAIEDNINNTLVIDDGLTAQNPTSFEFIPNTTAGDNGNGFLDSGDTFAETGATLRLGSEMTEAVEGVLRFQFGDYTLLTDDVLPIDPTTNEGARESTPDDVGGTLQVGAFNVLNYFTTLRGEGTSGPNNLSPRGAGSEVDLERQTDKLVAAMEASGVEIFAVQEVENNGFGSDSAIGTLTAALNTSTSGNYAVVDPNGGTTPFIGTDAITTGIIYDTSSVALVASAVVVFTENSAADTLAAAEAVATELGISNSISDVQRNRPAVVATFEDIATGEQFTVASVHYKSKGPSGLDSMQSAVESAVAAGGLTAAQQAAADAFLADVNVDQGDGQGYWNGVRADASSELYTFLTTSFGGSGVEDWVVLGDYNAYTQEDPTQAIAGQADAVDLIDEFVGPDAYSFVFDGQRGALDQAVASSTLAEHVTGLTEWHINADEPDLLNYNSAFNDPAFFNDDVFASSDHDPVILGLLFEQLIA